MTNGPQLDGTSTFRRAAAVAVGASYALRVISAIGGVLVARLLGPDDKGIFALATLAAAVGAIVGASGLESWTARELARARDIGEVWAVVVRHLRRAVVAGAALTLVACAIVSASGALSAGSALATGACAIGWTFLLLELAYVLALRKMDRYAVANIGGGAVYLAGAVALTVRDTPSLFLVLVAAAAGKWIPALWLTWQRRRDHGRFEPVPRPALDTEYRTALRFGSAAMLGELLAVGLSRLDIVLIALFLDARAVGLYVAATTLTEVIAVAPNALSEVFVPHGAAARPGGTAPAIRVSIAATACIAVVVGCTGGIVLPVLFGGAYDDAVPAVAPLAFAAVVLGMWRIVGADLVAAGSPRKRAWSGAYGVIAMLGIDVLLIPAFGIVGAAFGAIFGYSIATIIAVQAWGRLPDRSVGMLLRPTRADVEIVRRTLRRPRRATQAV